MLTHALATALHEAWTKRGWLAYLLAPLALLFAGLSGVRRRAYRSGRLRVVRVPVPVIVIGNLYVGGTGKTPLAIWLVQGLRERGFRPGVISRGYGAAQSAVREVTPDDGALGDEPALIAQHTGAPVFVAAERPAAAQALLARYPETDLIVTDDGLQHYALARDVEIALIDDRGLGNGWLLPAGPLREGAWRLQQVDAIVLRDDARSPVAGPSFRMRLDGGWARHLASGEERPLALFQGMSVLAAAGIARPERFFDLLRRHGLQIRTLPLPDHFAYATNPFETAHEPVILITEKDAVKCRALGDARLWSVPVHADVDSSLIDLVVEKLRGSAAA